MILLSCTIFHYVYCVVLTIAVLVQYLRIQSHIPLFGVLAMSLTIVDPFAAAAAGDGWSDDDAATHSPGKTSSTISIDIGDDGDADAVPQSCHTRKRGRPAGKPSHGGHAEGAPRARKERKSVPKTSVLMKVDPEKDHAFVTCETIFLNMNESKAILPVPISGRTPKRLRDVDYTPVCIWPQYTITNMDGRFIVVSPHESWMEAILHALRPKSDATNSAKVMRDLKQQFHASIKVVLRKSLSLREKEEPDSSDDEKASKCERSRSSFSGFKFENVPALKRDVLGHSINMLNCGRQLIVQVNNDAVKFIKIALINIVRQLALPTPTIPNPQSIAGFRFDDATPNIRGKVVWDPIQDCWQLHMGASGIRYTDANNQSLGVAGDLTSEQHARAKQDMYARAISAWNLLDKSKSKKITPPLHITVQHPVVDGDSPPSLADSLSLDADEAVEPMSLNEKWGSDVKL